jgi:hypothetical protein
MSAYPSKYFKTCNSLVPNSTLTETCLDNNKTSNSNKNPVKNHLLVKIKHFNGNSMSSEHRAVVAAVANLAGGVETQSIKSNKIFYNSVRKIGKLTISSSPCHRCLLNKNTGKNIEIFTFASMLFLFIINLHLPFFIDINLRFDDTSTNDSIEKFLANTIFNNNNTTVIDFLRRSEKLHNMDMPAPTVSLANTHEHNITIIFHQSMDLYSTYECSR